MPVTKKASTSRGIVWGLWEITESLEELMQQLPLNEHDIERLSQFHHDKGKKEYLASRLLVKHLVESEGQNYAGVKRDKVRKPFLCDSEFQLSISHSKNIAAAAIHPKSPIGIDVQLIYDKILDIAPRVLTEEELEDGANDIEKLIVYWCVKEALYKVQGRKGIDFRKELLVDPFHYKEVGHCVAYIVKDDERIEYRVSYKKYGENLLVMVV